MKARLEFRPLVVHGETVPVAWYEPAHYVGETVGAWLAKREPEKHWILLTPDRSMRWDGKHLLSAPALAPMEHGHAMSDEERARALAGLPWV
jgi:DNA polymerase